VSAEDPVVTLKNLLDEVSLKKDNGSDAASKVLVDDYEEKFFESYDVVLALRQLSDSQRFLNLSGSARLVTTGIRVGIWARDKTGITGRRILWDGIREVTRIVGKYAFNPGGILKWMRVASVSREPHLDVKPPFHYGEVIVTTYRYATLEGV